MPVVGWSDIDERIAAIDMGFDALEHGDLEAFMTMVAQNAQPDCEFSSALGLAMSNTGFRGFDGIRTWFTEFLETVAQPGWKGREYEVVSDWAFLFFASFEMKGVVSGVPVQTEVGQVFELEDGLVKRARSYASHAEARAAAEALHA